ATVLGRLADGGRWRFGGWPGRGAVLRTGRRRRLGGWATLGLRPGGAHTLALHRRIGAHGLASADWGIGGGSGSGLGGKGQFAAFTHGRGARWSRARRRSAAAQEKVVELGQGE